MQTSDKFLITEEDLYGSESIAETATEQVESKGFIGRIAGRGLPLFPAEIRQERAVRPTRQKERLLRFTAMKSLRSEMADMGTNSES